MLLKLTITALLCFTLSQALPQICSLPLVTGTCEGLFFKYGYDVKLGACRVFAYGGCDGNKNRFDRLQDCQKTCGLTTPPVTTVTPAAASPTGLPSVCYLPAAQPGPCEALGYLYSYNSSSGQCVRFGYGGCGGNANRFSQLADCERTCRIGSRTISTPITAGPISLCNQPSSQSGPCEAYIPQYSFDSKTGKCVKFIYGGCLGNSNRFSLLSVCQSTCGNNANVNNLPGKCREPIVTGLCKARMARYGFDVKKGKCVRFFYGGCFGNKNRFKSRQACEKKCLKA